MKKIFITTMAAVLMGSAVLAADTNTNAYPSAQQKVAKPAGQLAGPQKAVKRSGNPHRQMMEARKKQMKARQGAMKNQNPAAKVK